MQTENTNVIYKNDLDKACFQHDMTYDIYKDLAKRTQSDKVLRDKALEIANNPNWKLCWLSKRTGLLLYKGFDQTSSAAGMRSMQNQQLTNELHEPIIRKLKKKEFIFHLKTIFGVQNQLI